MRHSLSKRLSVRHYLRACLHGGGGPQVGEVTHLAVVEKNTFTFNLTTPGAGVRFLEVVDTSAHNWGV